MERDDLTLCSVMMVEWWTRKREMGDEDENDVEDTSGYETSRGDLPDWVGKTLHRGNYTPDWDLYVPYRGW
jgi:hypothetical protein